MLVPGDSDPRDATLCEARKVERLYDRRSSRRGVVVLFENTGGAKPPAIAEGKLPSMPVRLERTQHGAVARDVT